MSTFKARGLVIRETAVGESDKILTLLLKDIGKLNVSARGARKPKSKFLAGTQLFSYADFVIYSGGSFFSLCEASLIKSFYELRVDYERLSHGSLILEIAEKTLLPNMHCDDMLYLIIVTLARLCGDLGSPSHSIMISAAFEFKYLQLNGYGAVTECCADCGSERDLPYFGSNGALCRACAAGKRSVRFSDDALRAVEYILSSDIRDMYKFRASTEIIRELQRASKLMMDSNFEARFKCREMIIDNGYDN